MTDVQTMTVGAVALRKTDNGWEYLCEGVGGDPDSWCDATNVLGPFGGSGVNDLLDALASQKSATTSREDELLEVLKHIRGTSSCYDVWDYIDEVVTFD